MTICHTLFPVSVTSVYFLNSKFLTRRHFCLGAHLSVLSTKDIIKTHHSEFSTCMHIVKKDMGAFMDYLLTSSMNFPIYCR